MFKDAKVGHRVKVLKKNYEDFKTYYGIKE